MNLRESISLAQFTRTRWFSCLFMVVTAYAAWKTAQFVIAGDLVSLAMIGVAVLIAAVVVVILNNWRNGLYFFLAWLLFEDLIRKFLGNNMAIYFGKDFLVLVVYISFYMAVRRKRALTFRPPFLIPLLLLVWFGAMQIFNPASNSVWYGLLGFKVYFYYIPLTIVGYSLIDSEVHLRKFLTVVTCLGIAVMSLGIAQSIIGPSFLNPAVLEENIRGPSELYRVSPISGTLVFRPSAVFVSHGRYADFIIVSWLFVLGFGGYLLLRHKRGRLLVLLAIAVTTAASLLSGSRGVFSWTLINAVVVVVGFFWGSSWRSDQKVRVLRAIQRTAIGMTIAVAALLILFPSAIASRLTLYSETLSPSSTAYEVSHRAWDYPVANFLGAFDFSRWPYGYGIGTCTLGSQYVTQIFHARPVGAAVESGYGNIIIELGIVGLALWVITTVTIAVAAWRVVNNLRGSPLFPVAFVIFWYCVLLFFPMTFAGLQAYQDFIFNALLWLALGILFRLPKLALAAQPVPRPERGRNR
jgi:hypothetical protein